jgi:hypothetical protein
MFARIFFLLFACVLSTHAFAAEDSTETIKTKGAFEPAGTSTAEESEFSKVMDKVYINYFGIFHGPETTNLSAPYTPNAHGVEPTKCYSDGSNCMDFDSELTVAWMITKDIGIGPSIQGYVFPVKGYGAVIGDSGLKIFNKHFIRTEHFNMYANFYIQAPLYDYDRERGMTLGLKMTPYVRYDFAGTRFSVGAWTEEKAYLGVSDQIQNNKATKWYANPYVLYQQTAKFAWNLGFEVEADHMAGHRTFDMTLYQTDIMPGFNYSITPRVILNPYLQVFTMDKIAIDRTALGMAISATI